MGIKKVAFQSLRCSSGQRNNFDAIKHITNCKDSSSINHVPRAKAIDQYTSVNYWVRNLVHDTWAFRLLLSNGKFFHPDFVALLNDGRILVVEYKGEHLVEYSQEKKNIGEKWEEASNRKALFIMAVKLDEKGRDVYRQIEDKVK